MILWVVFLDAFETVVLPRRVTRQFKLTAWFYRRTWIPWKKVAGHIPEGTRRQSFLGYFGPLSLIMLLAFWATSLIFGFALLQYGLGGHEQLGSEHTTFARILYASGETFFTLGYGDIVPTSGSARFLSVLEAGMGFAFLGVVIGYIPVVYQSFSRREIQISMLDARAGSPPTAAELLVRLAGTTDDPAIEQTVLDEVLRDWERWAAELLESQLSYPVLTFFRSQHSNQSDHYVGCDFPGACGNRRSTSGAGAINVCHGAACGGGPGAGGECALRSDRARTFDRRDVQNVARDFVGCRTKVTGGD